MPRRRAFLVLPLALLLLAEAPLEAQTTIDFEAQACTGSTFNAFDSPLIIGGFSFTSLTVLNGAFATWCDGNPNWLGSALFNNFMGETIRLEKVGGGPFSIQSIDLASLFLSGSSTVGFTGVFADNSTIFQQFLTTPGQFVTHSFGSGFQDLVALEWAQEVFPFHQFDTLVLDSEQTVIPEPSTVILTLTGLLGIAFAARRRKGA